VYNSCHQRTILKNALEAESKGKTRIFSSEKINELKFYAKQRQYQLICYPVPAVEVSPKAIVIKDARHDYELNYRIAHFKQNQLFSGVFVPLNLKRNTNFYLQRLKIYHRFTSIFYRNLFLLRNEFSGVDLLVKSNNNNQAKMMLIEPSIIKAICGLFDIYPKTQIRLSEEFYEIKPGEKPGSHVLAISVNGVAIFNPNEIDLMFGLAEEILEWLKKQELV